MSEPRANASDHLESDQIDSLISAAGVAGARDILAAFWRSTETLLKELAHHLAAENFEAASCSAHALKGSAANIGAKRLAATAYQIELACRDRLASAAHDCLTAARNDFNTVRSFLEAHLNAA